MADSGPPRLGSFGWLRVILVAIRSQKRSAAFAGSTVPGDKGIRDEAITRDGRYLYAIHADAQKLFGWLVRSNGQLDPIGEFEGVPATVAGLAAS